MWGKVAGAVIIMTCALRIIYQVVMGLIMVHNDYGHVRYEVHGAGPSLSIHT